jgi:hypothetical protein
MWFSAIKLAVSAGTHIFKKRQETKMAMADAQYMHAQKMARGEETYQGKFGIKGTQIFRNNKVDKK